MSDNNILEGKFWNNKKLSTINHEEPIEISQWYLKKEKQNQETIQEPIVEIYNKEILDRTTKLIDQIITHACHDFLMLPDIDIPNNDLEAATYEMQNEMYSVASAVEDTVQSMLEEREEERSNDYIFDFIEFELLPYQQRIFSLLKWEFWVSNSPKPQN